MGERQEDGQKEGGSHNLEDSSREKAVERESTHMYMYMEWREKWCEQESFDL